VQINTIRAVSGCGAHVAAVCWVALGLPSASILGPAWSAEVRSEGPGADAGMQPANEQPGPGLSPRDVVQIQLRALQSNGRGDQGIAWCFEFASPRNKQFTGPLKQFAAMVKSPPYDVMVNHRLSLVGRAETRGNQAHVLATLVDARHRLHLFAFVLSKQTEGKYADCWMTDAVTRIGLGDRKRDQDVRLPLGDPV
jgi:hypothetical protein